MKNETLTIYACFLVFLFSCFLGYGARAVAGEMGATLVVGEGCGNGAIEAGEECDGGAGVPAGKRCTAQCALENITVTEEPAASVILPGIAREELKIADVESKAGPSEAIVSWMTNRDASCKFDWGETQEYEKGEIAEFEKKPDHRASLVGLRPDTEHFFEIICAGNNGLSAVETGKFKTLELVDLSAPLNASGFKAEAKTDSIFLSWANPLIFDFRAVKIMRSLEFFPTGINGGMEVYNDSGTNFEDKDVAVGVRYYYTAFSYDNSGNYSSGAIASAMIAGGTELPAETKEIEALSPSPADDKGLSATGTIEKEGEDNKIKSEEDARSYAFEFSVENGKIELENDGMLALPSGSALNIELGKKALPGGADKVILSIEREGMELGYFLKFDSNKDIYNTLISIPEETGEYVMFFKILDKSGSEIIKIKSGLKILGAGMVLSGNAPADKAGVTLFIEENGVLRKWRGDKYSQFNPVFTDSQGRYGFTVPNGRYAIRVEKNGFAIFQSDVFEVTDNTVNIAVELKPESVPKLLKYIGIYFYHFLASLELVKNIIIWMIRLAREIILLI